MGQTTYVNEENLRVYRILRSNKEQSKRGEYICEQMACSTEDELEVVGGANEVNVFHIKFGDI